MKLAGGELVCEALVEEGVELTLDWMREVYDFD